MFKLEFEWFENDKIAFIIVIIAMVNSKFDAFCGDQIKELIST